ncbi:hypothetical protein P875_00021847 [Aspergillus parasiticus SU-1]|uniref:DUF7136 domain-containing protein n=1 Tax=Aspergillus parasiticus (strain ATCC 56775 / NRRL 5862 / SRRC 143 / SU-1) TaxID=1403190 RepID=A0A0F0IFY2_ASPPU|nr:hypothetical protein P875_00021847 [Aspergillus parasiticus SU-1]
MGSLPLGWLLLALSLSLACSWASITPGVAEVDLIFPRNESFPPSSLTPIIFAIQNPSLLSSVYPRIRYYIEELGARGRRSFFSTKNGTSQPDFAAATEDGTCEESLAQAIHVQDFLSVPSGQVWGSATRTQNWYAPKQPIWRGSSCAVTADWVPTPSPCNVKIDPSAATSISAALTSTACANPLRTGLICPTPSSENAASVGQLPVERPWILAMGLLLAYGLA